MVKHVSLVYMLSTCKCICTCVQGVCSFVLLMNHVRFQTECGVLCAVCMCICVCVLT